MGDTFYGSEGVYIIEDGIATLKYLSWWGSATNRITVHDLQCCVHANSYSCYTCTKLCQQFSEHSGCWKSAQVQEDVPTILEKLILPLRKLINCTQKPEGKSSNAISNFHWLPPNFGALLEMVRLVGSHRVVGPYALCLTCLLLVLRLWCSSPDGAT